MGNGTKPFAINALIKLNISACGYKYVLLLCYTVLTVEYSLLIFN